MVDNLCSRYPSLNPFLIRTTKAREVFRILRLIRKSQKYKKDENVGYNNAQNFTNYNSSQRINVTGRRGTGGWI